MELSQILSQLNVIFRDILDNEHIELTPATSAKDIDEWDSLSHIHLVMAIEKHFKVRFTTSEIQGWKTVGHICENTQNRLRR